MSLIDIIIGVKNEEKHIEKCIRSLQAPKIEDINIIVIDGLSKDGTRKIVKRLMEKDERIRLLVNEREIISSARNIGLEASKADFVAYLDGHAFVGNDWLETLHETFLIYEKKCKLAGVGSTYAIPEDDSFFGKTVGYCVKTFFGGFGSAYTQEDRVRKVDTVAFALYRKSILDKEGINYDEKMTHCEDTDFNYKLIKKGYVLLKHPKAMVYQYRRNTMGSFFKQMVNYGDGRAKFTRKYLETLRLYHLLPPFTVVYPFIIIFSIILFLKNLISNFTLLLCLIPLVLYLTADIVYTLGIMIEYRTSKVSIAFLIFLAEHLGYGIGFLKGLLFKKRI